jgi:hypothetical protein
MICQIPRSKSVSYIFNEQFINYIAIIIATPFQNQINPDVFKSFIAKNKAVNAKVIAPPGSPITGGTIKQLKDIAKKYNIKLKSNIKKNEIIKTLNLSFKLWN